MLKETNKSNIKRCKEKGIGVLVHSGLARGELCGRILQQLDKDFAEKEKVKQLLKLVNNDGSLLISIALQFLYQNEGISSILIGTKNMDHIRHNIELLEKELSPELLNKEFEIAQF